MPKRWPRVLLTLLLAAWLCGCAPLQALRGRFAADAPAVRQAPGERVADLFTFIGSGWPDADLPGAYGPAIHYLDYAQMRTDLGQPPVGARLNDQQHRALRIALGKADQTLDFAMVGVNPRTDGFAARWGWDIADIEAALYVPDIELAILTGPFDHPRIARLMAAQGEPLGEAHGFERYSLPRLRLWVALDDRHLLIGRADAGVAELDQFLVAHSKGGAAAREDMQALLAELAGTWGGVLAPSGDAPASYGDLTAGPISQKTLDSMVAQYGEFRDLYAAWHVAAIAFRGQGQGAEARFAVTALYQYDTPELARDDVDTVRTWIELSPTLSYPGRTLGDLLTVQTVSADGRLVRVSAETESGFLIGRSFAERDAAGFFPLHDPSP
ncbi:MAG: hypothetical protein ACOX3S_03870 [Anaerolineae bacterium]|jgi:hypothetical protein